jgi:hypothetical protein
VATNLRWVSHDASSRIGREETLGGGSAFGPCFAGADFETVRVDRCTTTAARVLADAVVTGGENDVVGVPIVVALCGAVAPGAACGWIVG